MTIRSGTESGRELSLSNEGELILGSEVAGPGRIGAEGELVAPEHCTLRLHHLGLDIERLERDWAVEVNGVYQPMVVRTDLRPGDRIGLGRGNAIAEGDPRLDLEVASITVDWASSPGAEGALRDQVRIEAPKDRKYTRAVLEVAGDTLTLRCKDGPVLSAPTDAVEAKFPAHRFGIIELRQGSARFKLLIGPQASYVPGTEASPGAPGGEAGFEGYLGMVDDSIGAVRRRKARAIWQQVLNGEKTAAEVAAERRSATE